MELWIKSLEELSSREMTQIYIERVKVFVVEQDCPYQEVDQDDFDAKHVLLKEDNHILAYARIITKPDAYYIGRVLVPKDYRRQGYGTKMMQNILDYLDQDRPVRLSGQTYVAHMYENLGFIKMSDEYLEDGIPHVDMERHWTNN